MLCHLPCPLWNQFKAHAQKLKKDTGNVLFIILLAVALFAALAYAVTQSTRSGGGDASREQDTLNAAYLIQNSTSIESTIQRLRLSNGCDITQISFESSAIIDSSEPNYINPNSPADKRCHLFHPNGGNLSLPISNAKTPGWNINGAGLPIWMAKSTVQVCGVGTTGCTGWATGGDDKTDMVLNTLVSKGVCRAINDRLGIPSDSNGDPPPPTSTHIATIALGGYAPTGSFAFNGYTIGDCNCAGQATGFWFGYPQGCMRVAHGGNPIYYFYFHAVLPR